MLKKIGASGFDAINMNELRESTRSVEKNGSSIGKSIGLIMDKGSVFDVMEDKLGQLLTVTEEGVKQEKTLNAKDKIVDSSTQGSRSKAAASVTTMAAQAKQVNPNRIRLGSASGGKSIAKQQLDVQKMAVEINRKMNANLVAIADATNGWRGASSGGIGSGVGV